MVSTIMLKLTAKNSVGGMISLNSLIANAKTDRGQIRIFAPHSDCKERVGLAP